MASCDLPLPWKKLHLLQPSTELVGERGPPVSVKLRETVEDEPIYAYKYANVFVYRDTPVLRHGSEFAFKMSTYGVDARRNVVFAEQVEHDQLEDMRLVKDAAPWASKLVWDAGNTVVSAPQKQVLFKECGGYLISLQAICGPVAEKGSKTTPAGTRPPEGLDECRFESLSVAELSNVKRTTAPSHTLPMLQSVVQTAQPTTAQVPHE